MKVNNLQNEVFNNNEFIQIMDKVLKYGDNHQWYQDFDDDVFSEGYAAIANLMGVEVEFSEKENLLLDNIFTSMVQLRKMYKEEDEVDNNTTKGTMSYKEIYKILQKLDENLQKELSNLDGEQSHHIFEPIHCSKADLHYKINRFND